MGRTTLPWNLPEDDPTWFAGPLKDMDGICQRHTSVDEPATVIQLNVRFGELDLEQQEFLATVYDQRNHALSSRSSNFSVS